MTRMDARLIGAKERWLLRVGNWHFRRFASGGAFGRGTVNAQTLCSDYFFLGMYFWKRILGFLVAGVQY